MDDSGVSLNTGTTRCDVKSTSSSSTPREGNDVSHKTTRLFAVIGASAVVTVGAVTLGIDSSRANVGTDASSDMSTGVTATESAGPSIAPVIQAKPAIKGPAPLPPEEQGLPG
jgi:hypothetical protein